jgi:predicted GTPase
MITDSSQYVHIALIGAVSVGKSTLLNAIFTARVAPMAMLRTTAGEMIYIESSDMKKINNAEAFYEKIKKRDAEIMYRSTTLGKPLQVKDVAKNEIEVPLISEFVDGIHARGALLAIHDLPGLNDSSTKACYHEYIVSRFNEFDVILFIVDIQSGMNTSDEKDILTLIINGIKTRKATYGASTKLIVIVNKCDEMQPMHIKTFEMLPADQERKSMYDQVLRFTGNATSGTDIHRTVLCLSAEDAYVHRMFRNDPKCVIDDNHRNKFGINEFGKTKWLGMDQTARDQAITKHLKKNYEAGIAISGWKWFGHVLNENLNDEFLLDCTTTHIKRELRSALAKFIADHLAATTGRFNALTGSLLTGQLAARRILHFLTNIIRPLYEKYDALGTKLEQRLEHDGWFCTEIERFINVVAPSTLRGSDGVTNKSTFHLAVDVKRIYVFLHDSLPYWFNTVSAMMHIRNINSELLTHLYKTLFDTSLDINGIIANLVAIELIDSTALRVNPDDYTMSIPYRVCAKICDYKLYDSNAGSDEIALCIVEGVGNILLKCGADQLASIIMLREVIPGLEKPAVGTNYARIVAVFDQFFINVSAANQREKELTDYAFQCKARAITGASNYGSPGKNTTIAQLVTIVLKNLSVTYPNVFVDIGKHFLGQRAMPPAYPGVADEIKK